jgi:hypothetical protein
MASSKHSAFADTAEHYRVLDEMFARIRREAHVPRANTLFLVSTDDLADLERAKYLAETAAAATAAAAAATAAAAAAAEAATKARAVSPPAPALVPAPALAPAPAPVPEPAVVADLDAADAMEVRPLCPCVCLSVYVLQWWLMDWSGVQADVATMELVPESLPAAARTPVRTPPVRSAAVALPAVPLRRPNLGDSVLTPPRTCGPSSLLLTRAPLQLTHTWTGLGASAPSNDAADAATNGGGDGSTAARACTCLARSGHARLLHV